MVRWLWRTIQRFLPLATSAYVQCVQTLDITVMLLELKHTNYPKNKHVLTIKMQGLYQQQVFAASLSQMEVSSALKL